jgi:ribonuclease P protein component
MQSGGDTATPGKKVSARFEKASRLLKHADFDRVYRQGKRHFSANMTVFWAKRGEVADRRTGTPGATPARVGFTVGKVLGGAVVRNRIKRRLRDAVRLSLPGFATAVDVVINPKKSALTAEMPKLRQEIGAALAAIEKQNPTQRTPRTQREKES